MFSLELGSIIVELNEGTRGEAGFGIRNMGFGYRCELALRIVADEVGAEEIEGQRKPKNPFVISVKKAFFLWSSMFMQQLHLNVEPPVLGGSLLLHLI